MEEAKRGGAFMLRTKMIPSAPLAPERLNDSQREIARTTGALVATEVNSISEALEVRNTHPALMQLFGRQDCLGIEVPAEYGGLGLGIIDSTIVAEAIGTGGSGSFAATFGGHTGIATWPILFFGTEEQRQHYLPLLVSGDMIGAYALTEPNAGSDALAAKTTATHMVDGTWRLNGQKAFITNAGHASVFTVFAKVDGKNACFIVECADQGIEFGPEERKLGIVGSSTRSVIFDDMRLPADRLLGEVGKGHKIVLNTLNLGRLKIGASCVGGLKRSLTDSVLYALSRKQFGKQIAEFGAIRRMLAKTAIDAWVGESTTYRTAGLLESNLPRGTFGDEAAKAIHEYAIECSLVKVALSDMLFAACDRQVQIYGGNGAMEDYGAARAWRDARTIRIFEGTNEINALSAVGELIKRMLKGKLDPFAGLALGSAMSLGTAMGVIDGMRIAFALALKSSLEKFGEGIAEQQEILLDLARLMTLIYGAESAQLRYANLPSSHPAMIAAGAATAAYLTSARYEAAQLTERIISMGKTPDTSVEEALRMSWLHVGVRDLNGFERTVADAVIAAEGYPF